jgi:hypothetical protein
MFNRFSKNDLVAYTDHPNSIPLGIVKEVKENMGKAVVMVYLLDTFFEDEIGTIKCVPYHKLDLVSKAQKV